MATEFICSIRSSGGDYSTLTLWEAAIQADLTSANTLVFSHSGIVGTVGDGATVTGSSSGATGTVYHATSSQIMVNVTSGTFVSGEQMQVDTSNYVTLTDSGDSVIAVAECYNDWPSGLNDTVSVAGWTTNSTNRIIIRAAAGEGHSGTLTSGFYISISAGYTSALSIDAAYTLCKRIGVENSALGSFASRGISAYSADLTFEEVIAAAKYQTFWYNGAREKFINCLALQRGGSGGTFQYNSSYTQNTEFYNCTGASFAVGSNGNNCIARNCVAYSGGFSNTSTTGWISPTSNNADTSGSPPGTNPVTTPVSSSDFVNPSGDDYHLSTSSILKGAGANLSSQFTIDFEGDARPSSGAWDVGADQTVSSGTTHSAAASILASGSVVGGGGLLAGAASAQSAAASASASALRLQPGAAVVSAIASASGSPTRNLPGASAVSGVASASGAVGVLAAGAAAVSATASASAGASATKGLAASITAYASAAAAAVGAARKGRLVAAVSRPIQLLTRR